MSSRGRWTSQATVGLVLVVVGLAVAGALIALTVPRNAPLHPGRSGSGAGQVSGVGLGQRIFLTGTDENGHLIARSGGIGMMQSGLGCATCHGSDARGRTIQMMMGQVVALDIRWSVLTAPPTEPGDVAFDSSSFFRAVTQGIDPTGKALQPYMPHWELTQAESDSLVAFLKTL